MCLNSSRQWDRTLFLQHALKSTEVYEDIPLELYDLEVLTNELVLTVSHYIICDAVGCFKEDL